MSIFFIRHGESTANSGENDCVDASLNEKGIAQAREITIPISVDHVIVSPLTRAQQTYKYSSLYKIPVEVCKLCRERIFAFRDLLPGEEMKAESDEEFWTRVTKFSNHLKEIQKTKKAIVVFGHSYFFSAWEEARGMANGEMRKITRI